MGAILTGKEIYDAYVNNRLFISDFDEKCIGPNSYDIHTGTTWTRYIVENGLVVDPFNKNTYKTESGELTKSGLVVKPGEIVLIPTKESIRSDYYVPMITGRSSIGRLGISIHQEAGFGDIGYNGVWTLQISTIAYPVLIMPHMRIGQLYFLTPEGEVAMRYHGRYYGSDTAIPSRFYDNEQKFEG